MKDNESIVKLIRMLNKSSSQKQINSDIRELEKAGSAIRLTAILTKGESRQQLTQLVKQLENQLNTLQSEAETTMNGV